MTPHDTGTISQVPAATLRKLVDPVLLILVGAAGVGDGLRIILTKTDVVGGAPAGGWIALLGVLLIAGSGVLIAKEFRSTKSAQQPDEPALLKMPAIALGLLILYVALIDPLGYTLATALFMAVYLRLFGRCYGLVKVATIAIAFSVGSGWLWSVMNMMLPQGPLPWP
ncbi:tripartite tricarboxylate transporter TctB family protein [Pseudorhodoplanes sp.]|uniref:tripartite tricarboxylate transporter TctB family protein n=1 Tax=Pseudorhodoplanes sp. TaxID=1934341 RepID=UPI003D09BCC7